MCGSPAQRLAVEKAMRHTTYLDDMIVGPRGRCVKGEKEGSYDRQPRASSLVRKTSDMSEWHVKRRSSKSQAYNMSSSTA